MVAVDTNVLVRFLVRDDPKQAARAASLIRDNSVWISKTVLLETEWVLRSLYKFSPEAVATALRALAGLQNVVIEDEPAVAKALDWSKGGLDFADALHLASAAKAEQFATFDRKLVKRAQPLTGLTVVSL
jgi:predicted nucleic-acid-binding protein